jgi:hypothetical protein
MKNLFFVSGLVALLSGCISKNADDLYKPADLSGHWILSYSISYYDSVSNQISTPYNEQADFSFYKSSEANIYYCDNELFFMKLNSAGDSVYSLKPKDFIWPGFNDYDLKLAGVLNRKSMTITGNISYSHIPTRRQYPYVSFYYGTFKMVYYK